MADSSRTSCTTRKYARIADPARQFNTVEVFQNGQCILSARAKRIPQSGHTNVPVHSDFIDHSSLDLFQDVPVEENATPNLYDFALILERTHDPVECVAGPYSLRDLVRTADLHRTGRRQFRTPSL